MPLPPGYEWNQQNVDRYQGFAYREPTRQDIEQEQAEFDTFDDWDWQNPEGLGPQGEQLPQGALGWKPTGDVDWGTGLKGWWDKTLYNADVAYDKGYNEGLQISGLGKIAVASQTVSGGRGQQATEEDKAKVQEAITTEQESRAPETQFGAQVAGIAEATKSAFNSLLWGVLEGLGEASVKTEQVIGGTAYSIADVIEGKDVDFKQNFEAARMAYAGIFDASIREEMNRRLEAGVRGDLAAQEIMIAKPWTMWPQLVGQLVFDPLNTISAWGKAGQALKMEKSAQATFRTVENPVLREVLETATQAIGKMDEAQAYQYLDDIARSQQGLVAATAHAEDIVKAGKNLEEMSKSYKLSSLTADGKISHLANQTSEILMHVVNNSDPEEALEIFRGIIKSVNPNPAEAAEGVATMLRFADAKSLFSEAGNNTTVILSRMYEKYGDTWLKTLDELKGNPSELVKNLLGKLDDVGQEMFPSVSKMLEAEDAVKAAKAGVEISDATRKLAEAAKNLPNYVKAANRYHNNAQKVVAPLNKFFANVYMGWSPGYAFRNWSNNTLQILIDQGPRALLGKADDMFADAEKLHGGSISGAFGFGDNLGDEAATTGATTLKAGLKEIGEKTKLFGEGAKGPAQIAGAVFETNGAKRILAMSYKQTFERGVTAMTKALEPQLRAAGFSDDIIKRLPTYIMQNKGDAQAVVNAIRAEVDSGVIDMFNDISRIDPKYKSFLEHTGKWDEYAEKVLKAPTREEATAAAQQIFDELAQAADGVYSEQKAVVTDYDKAIAMFVDKGDISNGRGQLLMRRQQAGEDAMKVATEFINQADSLAHKFGLDAGALKPVNFYKKTVGNWGEDAAAMSRRLLDTVLNIRDTRIRNGNYADIWRQFPEIFDGPAPEFLDKATLQDKMWSSYFEKTGGIWATARDEAIGRVTGYLDNLKNAGAEVPDEWYDAIKTAQEGAQELDNVKIGKNNTIIKEPPVPYGTRRTQISQLAERYGVPSATTTGAPTDKKTLAIINKYAGTDYKSLEEVPLSVADEAFAARAGKGTVAPTSQAGEIPLSQVDELAPAAQPERVLPAPNDGIAPPASRVVHEQMEDVTKMRKWMMDDINANYGKKQITDRVGEQALRLAEKELTQKIAETRLIASRVAQETRNFTLLNYGEKSYWDVALAYLYPYHFWYKGTYTNWMKRLVTNPSILAHYQRYKDNLGTVHAGMPDWWRYNLNTNDLPGVNVDNPLYFNLEATLWPLNGLTGTDFNDPSKRVNWWTHSLDFMNKFGPSTWAPINIVTGLALYANGEKEAGEKWMGRLIPQSATIKAGASMLGIANLETDPLVGFLQGGLDPYERRRVQRALAAMEQEVLAGKLPYTQEQIIDAAYAQEGEIWDLAVKRAVNGRAPSQLASFLFGVGFKGRTAEDQEIDKFYTDYSKLWTMRPNLTEQEFREGMSTLKDKYPFMDTVLLSRRDDVNRDAGLAYTVLQRIPPGKSSQFAEAAGIDPALFDKFYADKGQIEKWSPSDRLKFMAGVMTISAVLEIPSDMTRAEWTSAKNAYTQLNTDAKSRFGDDILDAVDGFYAAKSKGSQYADAYLEKHPEVSEYMDWKAERIMGSDLLSAYYGGASMVENYYRGQMYTAIEKELGAEIFDVMDEYNDLKTFGTPAETKAFYNQHKADIKKYYALKDEWNIKINQNVAAISAHLPEGQGATIREDVDVTSPTQAGLIEAIGTPEQPALQDFQAIIPERLQNLMNDYIYQGERLPESAEKQLARLANEMGFGTVDDLLQAYGAALYAVP